MKSHSKQRNIQCSVCFKMFKHKHCLKVHKCSTSKLETHMKSHSKQRNIQCSVCFKMFKQIHCLKVHKFSTIKVLNIKSRIFTYNLVVSVLISKTD
ncbi:hypothetical protein KUTeg_023315 [Tegillarca granosa]|uniref:C2H2-type domain-containing protein n=1 Tax=Tegillarca granosa TaxID=220873 RepID=A0ABQ9E291_TEGGR|nr:hypothetical protein KUTeg_023315 [Tegillarca granosa]